MSDAAAVALPARLDVDDAPTAPVRDDALVERPARTLVVLLPIDPVSVAAASATAVSAETDDAPAAGVIAADVTPAPAVIPIHETRMAPLMPGSRS